MTPCEKLGYKVGDKFKMLYSSCGFEKGQTVTLFRDDRTDAPCFKGDNTKYNHAGGEPGAYINLSNVKPVSQRVTKQISNSKRQLAQLLIEAGVTQFPEGANWAAQHGSNGFAGFTNRIEKPKVNLKYKNWGDGVEFHSGIRCRKKIPNWHQTVLSRAEFNQIVAETVVQVEQPMADDELPLGAMRADSEGWITKFGASMPVPDDVLVDYVSSNDGGKRAKAGDVDWSDVEKSRLSMYRPTDHTAASSPTLDQLLQDWRNADDYAQRTQAEADEAAAMRDERWQAVQARAGEMGVIVGRCESVSSAPVYTFSSGIFTRAELKEAGWRDEDIDCLDPNNP